MINSKSFAAPGAAVAQQTVLGRVLGLVGSTFVMTAVGATIDHYVDQQYLPISIIAAFVSLIALMFLRNVKPLNLILLYIFATCEGLFLGAVITAYVADGQAFAVIDAAGTTALVTMAAGFYGVRTRRNFQGLAPILLLALLALIVSSFVGLVVHLPGLDLAISVAGAVLFTLFIVVDLQRAARKRYASEGDVIMMAVGIYLDIINLFLSLLRLFGRGR